MLALVLIALKRPYTFMVLGVVILILGTIAALKTPTDIFPAIGIPVVSVIWTYIGLAPDDMSGRVVYPYELALTTLVNDIEHIELQNFFSYRRHENLFPAQCEDRPCRGAGFGGLANRSKKPAARHKPAAGHGL